MTELVTVTPRSDRNDDGDPVPPGDPYDLAVIAVAPGNTTLQYGNFGDVEDTDFTVYLPTGSVVNDGDQIVVRGKKCSARVQLWQWDGFPVGGVVVLAKAVTGRA